MKDRRLYSLFLILFVALFLIIVVLFTLSLLIIITSYWDVFSSPEPTLISKSYRLQEFDHEKKRLKLGLVEMTHDLVGEEYLTYNNENTGNQIFVTNFGGSKYKCHGTCSCTPSSGERNNNRKSTTVLKSSLYILISALSATMAMNMARETFKQECVTHFSKTNNGKAGEDEEFDGNCREKDIEYDLDICDNPEDAYQDWGIHENWDEKLDEIKHPEKKEKEEEYGVSDEPMEDDHLYKHTFHCTGSCVTDYEMMEYDNVFEEAVVEFRKEHGPGKTCKDLKFEKTVKEDCFWRENCEQTVISKFDKADMAWFCPKNSQVKLTGYVFRQPLCMNDRRSVTCKEIDWSH